MFIALDKLKKQDIKKVIVAVPEKSIGASFGSTELKNMAFFPIGIQTQNTIYLHQAKKIVKYRLS